MFSKKILSNVAYLPAIMASGNALAHHEHGDDGYHQLLQFLALGAAPLVILGSLYFMLVMIGKFNVKKTKGVTE